MERNIASLAPAISTARTGLFKPKQSKQSPA
jgi:hypothetical protein